MTILPQPLLLLRESITETKMIDAANGLMW